METTQIGDVGYHWKTHTDTGWMNNEAFKYYLMKLREYVGHDETLHLVIDLYPAHMTEDVQALAASMNFQLHIIPAGITDIYQQLDRKIFGVVKAKARKLFRLRNQVGKPLHATKKKEACEDMISAWEGISYFKFSMGNL